MTNLSTLKPKWNNFMWGIMGKCLIRSVSPTNTHRLGIIFVVSKLKNGKECDFVIVCIANIFHHGRFCSQKLLAARCTVSNKGECSPIAVFWCWNLSFLMFDWVIVLESDSSNVPSHTQLSDMRSTTRSPDCYEITNQN